MDTHTQHSQQQHALRPSSIGHQQLHHSSPGLVSSSGEGGAGNGVVAPGGLEARQSQASSFKLTRGRSAASRYLQTTTTTTTTTHYQQPSPLGFAGAGQPPPPIAHTVPPRVPRHGTRSSSAGRNHHHHHQHHLGSSRHHIFSDETKKEVPEEDEATLRELLIRSVSSLTSPPAYRPYTYFILIFLSLFRVYEGFFLLPG